MKEKGERGREEVIKGRENIGRGRRSEGKNGEGRMGKGFMSAPIMYACVAHRRSQNLNLGWGTLFCNNLGGDFFGKI